MTTIATEFLPGNLVRARGREWVVQSDTRLADGACALRLRPLGGSDDDVITLLPELEEFSPVEPATFEQPNPAQVGNHAAALLLRDALRLKLRAGGGPFRSFDNIAVEPCAYQLVPLLMALRLSASSNIPKMSSGLKNCAMPGCGSLPLYPRAASREAKHWSRLRGARQA